MSRRRDVSAWPLMRGLRDPRVALGWTMNEWDHAVRSGRRLRLLSRLASGIEAAGLLAGIDPAVRRHLIGEIRLSEWRTRSMTWAMHRIGQVLADECGPLVLLKGAAYVALDLPIAGGRLPSDLDILVPKDRIERAVELLRRDGWTEVDLDEHDQTYYREWSHEVPPMHHPAHAVELDLHHNILPPIARTRVDAARLLACIEPTPTAPWHALQPADLILHSAAHLFLDAEARLRLRDLVDLDGLMRLHATGRPDFWAHLSARALELGLAEPLALASLYCHSWLGTPIPESARQQIAQHGPSGWRASWMRMVLDSLLTPAEPDIEPPWTQEVASWLFLARYHYNRMPLKLLVPHLWHKVRAKQIETTLAGPPLQ